MNKREAAIVSAHTGYRIGTFEEVAKYCQEILRHRVSWLQYQNLHDEIKEASKIDFVSISFSDEDRQK